MRKCYLLLAGMAIGGQVFAKPVSEQTAKVVGYNFLSGKISKEVLRTSNDLQLVYTAKSSDVQPVNYYYVFNVPLTGFVMVAADDQVIPIFGYSSEDTYDPNNVPDNAAYLFNGYVADVDYVIKNNAPATGDIMAQWNELLTGGRGYAAKTTAVAQLATTKWNQSGAYNDLCPLYNGVETVTGCVATAMAQVMKYWNYPTQGTGSRSYVHPVCGTLSANFGATTYQWSSMPNSVTSANNAVATLMYHCGVAVDMQYNTAANGGSGAYTNPTGTKANAESALKNYFGYHYTTHSLYRSSGFTDQAWVDSLKKEFDNGRVVLYAGTGSAGGHAWVADGYDASDNIHMNWGWGGGGPDGFYAINSLNPPALGAGGGAGGFNTNHRAIVGIMPPPGTPPPPPQPSAANPDQYDVSGPNNVNTAASGLPVNFNGQLSTVVQTNGSNFHNATDVDYYKITLPAGRNYTVNARLQDKKSNSNGAAYTVDAKFAYSTTANQWSASVDEIMSKSVAVQGGTTVVFKVEPYTAQDTGSYQLDITVTDVTTTGVTSISATGQVNIYPNPASGTLNVEAANAKQINIVDLHGRTVKAIPATGSNTKVSLDGVASGLYLVQIVTDKETITKKVTVR